MSTTERAQRAGQASAAAKTPEEREEAARHAAAGAHGPVATARKLAARWDDSTDEQRREVRRILREAGIIR